MRDPIREFENEVKQNIKRQADDKGFKEMTDAWMVKSMDMKYSYNFCWMGRPIIQYPQDIVQMQELIWNVQPDLIIETGIAHGGSLIFYASMLKLLKGSNERHVLGIDIDIREHNRREIEKHPMYDMIDMIEGSSIDDKVVNEVVLYAKKYKNIMVVLDSNHTYDHVMMELKYYSKLVSKGSYLCIFDTCTEMYFKQKRLSGDVIDGNMKRAWNEDNNPYLAAKEFANKSDDFVVDETIDNKLMITCAAGGYLKRIK